MTKQNKPNFVKAVKAYVALAFLTIGAVRTLVLETNSNRVLILVIGVGLAVFCLLAVVDYVFDK